MTKITPYNSEIGAGACSPLFRKGYWVNIFNPIKNIGRTTQVKVLFKLMDAILYLLPVISHSSISLNNISMEIFYGFVWDNSPDN